MRVRDYEEGKCQNNNYVKEISMQEEIPKISEKFKKIEVSKRRETRSSWTEKKMEIKDYEEE